MHSNNSGSRYGNHLGVSSALSGGPNSYLSTSLGAASPSDIGGFGSSAAASSESAFATTITAAQSRQQKQMEIIAEMERAAKNGDYDALINIIEEGMSTGDSSHVSVESQDDTNKSKLLITKKDLNRSLLLAVQHCQATQKIERVLECINVLLQYGANANSSDPQQDGKTVLMIACEKGFIEIVASLASNDDCQINYKDSKQKTPLLYALDSAAENLDVIQLLISKGADITMMSLDGWSPLLKATQKQFHGIMQYLLDQKLISLQRHSVTHNTALHLACENGDLEAVKLLIRHGCADLEALNRDKETPLLVTQRHLASCPTSSPLYAQHEEIYQYLKGVWEEKEKRAQQAKDELVKQEELHEEREKKKQQRQKQQHAQLTKQSNSKNANSQHTVQLQAMAVEESKVIDSQMENVEVNNSVQEEEKKIEVEYSEDQKRNNQSQADDPSNFRQYSGTTTSKPQYENLDQSQISNPLSHAMLGHSPILDFTKAPFGGASSVSQQNNQQQVATSSTTTDHSRGATTTQQQNSTSQQNLQSTPKSTTVTNSTPSNSSKPQTQQQQQLPSTLNTNTNTNNNSSSGKKQAPTSTNATYPPPSAQVQGGNNSTGYYQSNNNNSQRTNNNNNRGYDNQQQQQQQYGNIGAGNGNGNNNGQSRKQSGSNNYGMANSGGVHSSHQSNVTGGKTGGNKSLPFQFNNNNQSNEMQVSPQQHQHHQNSNRVVGMNIPQMQALGIPGMPQQQPAMMMMPNPTQSQTAQGAIQLAGNNLLGSLSGQKTAALAQQAQPGIMPQLNTSNLAAAMFPFNNQQVAALQNFFPTHFPLQQQLGGFQQHLAAAQQLLQHPQAQHHPLLSPGGGLGGVTNQGGPTQQQAHFSQPSSFLASTGGANQSQQQQPQQIKPPVNNTAIIIPMEDELDLSETGAMQAFIAEQQLYQAQKKLEEKDFIINTLKFEQQTKNKEFEILQLNLSQSDHEISSLRQRLTNYEIQAQELNQQINHIQNDHKQELNKLQLHLSYQIDKQNERCLEMERLLMKIHTVHKQVTDKIVQCYEEKRLFSEEEISEVQGTLKVSQLSLNQILITHNSEFNSNNANSNSSVNKQLQQLSQSMTTSSQSVQRYQSSSIQSNKLVNMIERFESPQQSGNTHDHQYNNSSSNDQNDVYNKLHLEVLQFRDSVKEILGEMQPIKEQIIENLTAVIKKAVPQSEVKVYGSHATKLCLPWSDIDLVIITPQNQNMGHQQYNPKSVLSQINQELRNELQNKWVSSVTYVDNASVPVVKVNCHIKDLLLHSGSSVVNQIDFEKYKVFLDQPFNIDITQMTDHHNGLECVSLVQEYLAENEIIEPLILVLKQLLKACQLNNPYFGGLSSYALFLMIVSYLQSHEQARELSKVNLGRILINFLSFYGSFDHENMGISCHLPQSRQGTYQQMDIKANQYPLLTFVMMPSPCIQIDDPLNPHNNVGKSSFKFYEVKLAFDYSQRVFFLGCFCDCHNCIASTDQHNHTLPLPGGSKDVVSQRRQCDSVLSRVIYSFKMYEQIFGPFHPMG